MRRRPVNSSSVKAVGYDVPTSTLELEYVSGSVYRYADVPQPVYAGLMAAPSIGSYVNSRIKPCYDFTEV
jgi:hypothetical protein